MIRAFKGFRVRLQAETLLAQQPGDGIGSHLVPGRGQLVRQFAGRGRRPAQRRFWITTPGRLHQRQQSIDQPAIGLGQRLAVRCCAAHAARSDPGPARRTCRSCSRPDRRRTGAPSGSAPPADRRPADPPGGDGSCCAPASTHARTGRITRTVPANARRFSPRRRPCGCRRPPPATAAETERCNNSSQQPCLQRTTIPGRSSTRHICDTGHTAMAYRRSGCRSASRPTAISVTKPVPEPINVAIHSLDDYQGLFRLGRADQEIIDRGVHRHLPVVDDAPRQHRHHPAGGVAVPVGHAAMGPDHLGV